ncbi:glycosyl transferase family 21-domain-containing protein [Cokeromyces recurvatus]|uniref:glycosyl transferase family 21-domain-containing protein n=1 Tax=Cokeromyces recurvatus TaxID=90255 RepID=UPI00221F798A|nr:glycosyl transferase family 21-domain-containing protein [Cokeromyces recurvatus]KAI7898569.1 glycosyl transferase family 21-domain-containing protein [Cokeromyces recurvatus]
MGLDSNGSLLTFISYICFVWYVFMFSLSLLGQYIGQKRYRHKPRPKSSKLSATEAEGVSIIRPLKGIDLELERNLQSSFIQNYPKFELIFSVASSEDPAIPIIEKLMEIHSHVDCKLIIGDLKVGINPKINNIIKSYKLAKYDIIWVLDSNVQIDKDALGRSVDALKQTNIGLVHHLPIALHPTSLAAEIEHIFLNTNHAKMYLAINAVGLASCVMGKSNLYRRSQLGSLEPFGQYMAEDNHIGEKLWSQHLRHAMTCDTATQLLGSMSLREYVRRRERWVRIRKHTVTVATWIEPITESVVCGWMGAFAMKTCFGISPGYFFMFHWIWWFLNDYFLYCTLVMTSSASTLSLPLWKFMRAWILREVLALPIYLFAMGGNEIIWREQRYMCTSNGSAIPI